MNKKNIIFITGGASGIGAATVDYFYQRGWRVFFTDIDSVQADILLKQFDYSNEVVFFRADVKEYSDMLNAVEKCISTFGNIHAVFANAGIHHISDILSTTSENWDNVIDVNLKGTFHTVKAALPKLLENEKSSIILMGSDQSLIGKKNSFIYGLTKGAIGQMTKSLALDYAKQNVRVNCVCPGTIDTPLSRKTLQKYADKLYNGNLKKIMEVEASEFPLGRIGQPEEVAKVVYFLASDSSSYMTGTLLPIDGGYTAE